MTADFRLQESQDGSVSFESVTCPGSCVGIQSKGALQKNLHIFLVVSASSNVRTSEITSSGLSGACGSQPHSHTHSSVQWESGNETEFTLTNFQLMCLREHYSSVFTVGAA